MHRLFSVFSPATRWSRPVVGAALTAGLVLSAGAKQPLQNAEAPAEQVEQSATSSRNTSSRATLSSGKEGGRYELTPERRALLNTIRYAEGTWKDGEDKGYRIMYGGGQFQDLSRHPERVIVKRYTSAAAGAYQFLPKTWKGVAKELKLSSFEPRHQDQAALHLVERRGALKEIDRKGLTRNAMAKLAPEWASFPTWTGRSAYGQPVKSPQDLASFYSSNLRQLRNQLGA
ncbi:MAG: glycoside hydrolase family 104 protein [Cyanobacteria bacterium MAG STY1_bin_7]|nr:glycoside hydrolase family 104 protein [Cyanobacteria bacterium MAG STY1_bin_7]MEC7652850.1 glycoside hydrolase family 104 protein [Cyanobacteriota bacterium]